MFGGRSFFYCKKLLSLFNFIIFYFKSQIKRRKKPPYTIKGTPLSLKIMNEQSSCIVHYALVVESYFQMCMQIKNKFLTLFIWKFQYLSKHILKYYTFQPFAKEQSLLLKLSYYFGWDTFVFPEIMYLIMHYYYSEIHIHRFLLIKNIYTFEGN